MLYDAQGRPLERVTPTIGFVCFGERFRVARPKAAEPVDLIADTVVKAENEDS